MACLDRSDCTSSQRAVGSVGSGAASNRGGVAINLHLYFVAPCRRPSAEWGLPNYAVGGKSMRANRTVPGTPGLGIRWQGRSVHHLPVATSSSEPSGPSPGGETPVGCPACTPSTGASPDTPSARSQPGQPAARRGPAAPEPEARHKRVLRKTAG